MKILDELRSVLCDPEGKVCIEGSNEDRAILQGVIKKIEQLEAENAGLKELQKIKR